MPTGPWLDAAKRFYARRHRTVWAVALGLPVAILALGLLLAPQIFYDHYVWRDIYGPLVVDAREWGGACLLPSGEIYRASPVDVDIERWWQYLYTPQRTADCFRGGVGAVDGYTPFSEATYALVLAVSLFSIYRGIFQRQRVRADAGFVLGLFPFILMGPVTRVLEDANTFHQSAGAGPGTFAVLFISPVIYIHIAIYTVAALLLGVFLANRFQRAPPRQLLMLVGLALAVEVAAYGFITTRYAEQFLAVAPAWIMAVAAALSFTLFARQLERARATTDASAARGLVVNATLFTIGLPIVAPAIYLVGIWIAGHPWLPGWTGIIATRPAGAIFGLAALVTISVAAAAALMQRMRFLTREQKQQFVMYLAPLNLAIVLGHMIDGIATWFAMGDPFNMGPPLGGYGQKHPLPAILLGLGGGGIAFPIVKLAMALIVIHLLDREVKASSSNEQNLVGLLKMAILVLGFAPGTRDLLRVWMGV